MRKLALLTIIVSALIGPTPAQAKSLKLVKCSVKSKLSTHRWCANYNLNNGQAALRFLRQNKKAGTRHSRRSVRRSGRYLVLYGTRHLQLVTIRSRPPHYYGWLCIHSREGAWTDSGAPYYGGLQMHEGWGGVRYANLLSPMEQMWLAERVMARTGFSYSAMKQQWPNTFPPCASYF